MTHATIAVTVDVLAFAPSEHGPAVLCVERGHPPYAGAWALPGGFVDEGEGLEEAACRELLEETGLETSPNDLIQLGAFADPGRDPRGRTLTVAYMLLLREMPEVRGGSDAERAHFWPIEGLFGGLGPVTLAFDHEEILRAALEQLERVPVEQEEPEGAA